MIVVVIILAVLVVLLGFTTLNLMKKQERAEDIVAGYMEYLDKLSRVIEISDKKLRELDQTGAFKNDDETGVIFKSITQIQAILNEFMVQRIKNE
jgi:hypothetical protein